jgi:hypothetical protein
MVQLGPLRIPSRRGCNCKQTGRQLYLESQGSLLVAQGAEYEACEIPSRK